MDASFFACVSDKAETHSVTDWYLYGENGMNNLKRDRMNGNGHTMDACRMAMA
ncbi:MAG: hypothetical protein ACI4HI_04720 [Lachnospiraceae bacterium]